MITIRKAEFKDTYNIYACNRKVLPISYALDEYLYFILLSPYKEVLIAEVDSKLCGYILGEYDGKYMHVLSFAVYPEYRRKGVGKKLMDGLLDIAKKDKNINALSLNVHVENEGGLSFYKAYGFKNVETLKNYYFGSLNAKSQDAYRLEYPFKDNKQS